MPAIALYRRVFDTQTPGTGIDTLFSTRGSGRTLVAKAEQDLELHHHGDDTADFGEH